MIDADISAMKRALALAPEDKDLEYRYRVALVRAGRHEEAGIQEGDEVEVVELDDFVCHSRRPWTGVITGVSLDEDTGEPEGWDVDTKDCDFSECGGPCSENGPAWATPQYDRITLISPARPGAA